VTAVIFDPDEAIARCYNSRDSLRKMIQFFFDEQDALFPQMRAALASGDLKEIGRLGHRMKGTLAYLAAEPAKQAALQVERFCTSSDGSSSEAEQAIQTLEHACRVLKEALSRHPLAPQSAPGDSQFDEQAV
jgi:HPt (histidine-containing phosphotransfer) domain-containing protein